MVLVLSKPSLEKLSLISSCNNTLFVLHLVKSDRVLFLKVKNLEPFTLVSKSLAKSKLLIASTLCLSLSSSMLPTSRTTVWFDSRTLPNPTARLDVIAVSAKFLSPEGWTKRFTGLTNFSHSTELLIVYDKFW